MAQSNEWIRLIEICTKQYRKVFYIEIYIFSVAFADYFISVSTEVRQTIKVRKFFAKIFINTCLKKELW